jgi:hypothetical protein
VIANEEKRKPQAQEEDETRDSFDSLDLRSMTPTTAESTALPPQLMSSYAPAPVTSEDLAASPKINFQEYIRLKRENLSLRLLVLSVSLSLATHLSCSWQILVNNKASLLILPTVLLIFTLLPLRLLRIIGSQAQVKQVEEEPQPSDEETEPRNPLYDEEVERLAALSSCTVRMFFWLMDSIQPRLGCPHFPILSRLLSLCPCDSGNRLMLFS